MREPGNYLLLNILVGVYTLENGFNAVGALCSPTLSSPADRIYLSVKTPSSSFHAIAPQDHRSQARLWGCTQKAVSHQVGHHRQLTVREVEANHSLGRGERRGASGLVLLSTEPRHILIMQRLR